MIMIVILGVCNENSNEIAKMLHTLSIRALIKPYGAKVSELKPEAIILSDYESNTPNPVVMHLEIKELNIPVLAVNQGFNLLVTLFNGTLTRNDKTGIREIKIKRKDTLLNGLRDEETVVKHNAFEISMFPKDFELLAYFENNRPAVISLGNTYAVNFKVTKEILGNFIQIHGLKKDWDIEKYAEEKIKELKKTIKDEQAVMHVNNDPKSAVTAEILNKAIGENAHFVFVNTGLIREEALEDAKFLYSNYKNFHYIDASSLFLTKLQGIIKQEFKEAIINNLLINMLENKIKLIGNIHYIVSQKLCFDLLCLDFGKQYIRLEPLNELYPEEIQTLAVKYRIDMNIITRHEEPSDPLSNRILGKITKGRLQILKKADKIFSEELKRTGFYNSIRQAYTILVPSLPETETNEMIIILKALNLSGEKTKISPIPYEFLEKIGNKIKTEIPRIKHVVYDI